MISFIPFEYDGYTVFRAFESEKQIGECSFTVDGYVMRFTAMNCDDGIITEGLARAAMNCAANRNAYISEIGRELVSPAFIRLGFEGDDVLSVEIPQALGSCCSCGE